MFLMLAGTPVLTALALLLTPIHRESSEWGRMPGIHSQSAILIEGDANEIVPNAKLAAAMHGFVIMGIQVCEHSRTNGSPLSRGARELGIELGKGPWELPLLRDMFLAAKIHGRS